LTLYVYKAFKVNDMKSVETGKIDANSLSDARTALRQKGLIPTDLTPAGSGSSGTIKDKTSNTSQAKKIDVLPKISLNQKIDLTTTLHALLNAGVPIIEALIFVQKDVGNKKVQKICFELKKSIISGATFASAIARHPNVFDKVYIGLIKAGEDAGEMESTMGRLITLLKKQQKIRSKVVGALIYPAFLILVALAAIIVLLTFVFPAFEGMFASLGGELPIITVICMSAGKIIKLYWYIMLFAVGIAGICVWYLFKWEPSRRIIDTYSLKIPLLSSLLTESNLSNFLAVLQVSYDAGIPIVECLNLAGLTLDNYYLRDNLTKAIVKVQQGVHLSTALRATNAFPTLVMFLMGAGEQSGQLGEMLNHCVTQIDKKLDDVIDRMTKMIEPIMLIVMGGVVLFMALALYLPLFKSYTLL